jgi:uncharacterized phage protein gp47/JayE
MSSYGVTSAGFVQKTLEDIKTEIEAALRASLGDGINLLSTSVFGQIVGIVAEREAEIWEVAAAVYASQYPQSASGQSLDNVAAITGVTRLEAVATTVNVQCTGTPTTVIDAGKVVSNDVGTRFALATAATIAAATAWAGSTAYNLGDIVTNDSNIYVCSTAGTSAGAGGPTGTGDGIVDNTCQWNFVGDGTGNVLGAFAAEETGPLTCVTGAIDTEDAKGQIETPVAGWGDARNLEDGDVGRDQETDAELRIRREQLLASTGNATLDALIAKVGEVDGVTQTVGFENTTDATDVDGLPPHSFEIIASGGANQDIVDTIWETKAAGIASYGSVSGTAIDSIGNPHTVYFSRPVEKTIHVLIELTKNDDYPADGDAQVKAAVKAYGDTLDIGDDVITSQLYEPIFQISGVVDVTKLWIGLIDPPTGAANITIAKDELATFDTGDIDVTST